MNTLRIILVSSIIFIGGCSTKPKYQDDPDFWIYQLEDYKKDTENKIDNLLSLYKKTNNDIVKLYIISLLNSFVDNNKVSELFLSELANENKYIRIEIIKAFGKPGLSFVTNKLIEILYFIFEDKLKKIECNIINQLLNKKRLKIKKIINDTYEKSNIKSIDYIITTTLRLKSSYIEYGFYSKLLLIMYFMKCEKIDARFIEIVERKIKHSIDYLYFTESRARKMLKDLGFFERDIEMIIKIIGDDFKDAFALKNLLTLKKSRFHKLSILSKHIIKSLI